MQRTLKTLLLLTAVINLTALQEAKAVSNGSLTVTINGFKSQRGQVCLSLFSGGRGFPSSSDRAVAARCVKLENAPLTVKFDNLKAGNYAIAAFHDANGDGILNRNPLGIPTEEFGFSQNPKILTGAPKFADSAFLVAGPQTNIQIQLLNFFG
ncbi:DUF2141 domain-containing protein [Plectonema radiosum NIES-515]|jgi:uncharacterized protein (DUF2141 family)|uniref:DUF2141 domain-containing protein n=1 Tax=Plectonema radiosum NIES-515 TaxID=2986073 RepID=A0ABT3AUN7_9CYAN|nr:DUF2141 domain-containing protein [Plectonema radiosum]MCV3212823.1 DUF2141 domain-containing protein [Plectonema radiosum NIES-515]